LFKTVVWTKEFAVLCVSFSPFPENSFKTFSWLNLFSHFELKKGLFGQGLSLVGRVLAGKKPFF